MRDGGREVRVERRGSAGFLILNRIAALNALTLRMVRESRPRSTSSSATPVIGSSSAAPASAPSAPAATSLALRARPGRRLRRAIRVLPRGIHAQRAHQALSQAYVAVIDGIVMGGGVGVSLHGSHRVAARRRIRHAGGRHRLLPRCRRHLRPAPRAASDRRRDGGDRLARQRPATSSRSASRPLTWRAPPCPRCRGAASGPATPRR